MFSIAGRNRGVSSFFCRNAVHHKAWASTERSHQVGPHSIPPHATRRPVHWVIEPAWQVFSWSALPKMALGVPILHHNSAQGALGPAQPEALGQIGRRVDGTCAVAFGISASGFYDDVSSAVDLK
jgi:hypothetical protein